MFDYFELGLSERLFKQPHQLSDRTRVLLKQAFNVPPAYTGQQPPQEQQHSGIPWKTLALTGLLGAGGAYAHGQLAQNSPFSGFSQGINNNVINPMMGRIHSMFSSPEGEAARIQQDATQGGLKGAVSGINNASQLQGTDYYEPGKLERAANIGGIGATVASAGHLGLMGAKGLAKMLPGNIAGRLAGTTVGAGLNTVEKTLGKYMMPMHALTTIPDSLQLGDKLNDSLGVQNGVARNMIRHGTVAAGAAGESLGRTAGRAIGTTTGEAISRAVGARLGGRLGSRFGGAGALLGAGAGVMAPNTINNILNKFNNNHLLTNQAAGRAGALKNDFLDAIKQKGWGNANPLEGWYQAQRTPEYLRSTLDQFKDDPSLQAQIRENAPTGML